MVTCNLVRLAPDVQGALAADALKVLNRERIAGATSVCEGSFARAGSPAPSGHPAGMLTGEFLDGFECLELARLGRGGRE